MIVTTQLHVFTLISQKIQEINKQNSISTLRFNFQTNDILIVTLIFCVKIKIIAFFQGTNFGTIISLPLSGWLCSLDLWGGWPLSFYLFGLLGIIWFGFWLFFVYDTPSSHPRICRQEQAYILASIGPQVSQNAVMHPLNCWF